MDAAVWMPLKFCGWRCSKFKSVIGIPPDSDIGGRVRRLLWAIIPQPVQGHNGKVGKIHSTIAVYIPRKNYPANRLAKVGFARFCCAAVGAHIDYCPIGERLISNRRHRVTRVNTRTGHLVLGPSSLVTGGHNHDASLSGQLSQPHPRGIPARIRGLGYDSTYPFAPNWRLTQLRSLRRHVPRDQLKSLSTALGSAPGSGLGRRPGPVERCRR